MKYPKPVVGQEVYVPAWSYNKLPTVTKVGRKYFYLSSCSTDQRFHINTWLEDTGFGSPVQAYPSKEVYDLKVEVAKLHSNIRSEYFGPYSTKEFTLDQLKRIKAILEEE